MDYKTAVANYTKSPWEGDLRIAGTRCCILFLTEKLLIDIKIAVIAPTFAKLSFKTDCSFPFVLNQVVLPVT